MKIAFTDGEMSNLAADYGQLLCACICEYAPKKPFYTNLRTFSLHDYKGKRWDDKQLANHYAQMQKGMSEKFNWLTVEYGSCYPSELEKRLSLLPIKPEIVVVDHLGLLRSKQRDNNMKVEEASQALMELAVQHKIIVFAVSEITKTAMTEGMNIASSRGSFRIAYNANKVLSITPFKNEDNVIRSLKVESTANREKEWLNVDLPISGVQIR